MPSELNRLHALTLIHDLRLQDAVAVARKLRLDPRPDSWPALPDPRGIDKAGFRRLLEMELSNPDHPRHWHQRAVSDALRQPRAREMYFIMRRNLWNWPEFLSLNEKARLILDIVIELAREEAFPWHVNVKAREVMKLARTNHATMAAALRQLQCLAITRPARPIQLLPAKAPGERAVLASGSDDHPTGPKTNFKQNGNSAAMALGRCEPGGDDSLGCGGRGSRAVQWASMSPQWPCAANNWGVDPDEPLREVAQWVIRYRHGSPRNAGRAA